MLKKNLKKMDRATRTYLLAMFAVLAAVVGFVSSFPSVREHVVPARNNFRAINPFLAVSDTLIGLKESQIGWPGPIAIAEDRIFVVDRLATQAVIKVFTLQGDFLYTFGAVSEGLFSRVADIALDPAGRVVVLDEAPAILVFTLEGKLEKRIDLAHYEARFHLPYATSILATAEEYYLLSLDRLVRLDKRGQVLGRYSGHQDALTLGLAASQFPMAPAGLLYREGDLWVADSVNGRLLRFSDRGGFDSALPLPQVNQVLPYPTSLELFDGGNFLVVDAARQVLVALSTDGNRLWELPLNPLIENQRGVDVADIAVDAHGGLIYISNFLTGRVERLSVTNGRLRTRQVVLTAQADFIFPEDLAVINNELFILSATPGGNGAKQIFRADLGTRQGSPLIAKGITGAKRLAAGSALLYVLAIDQVFIYTTSGELVNVVGAEIGEWGGFGTVNFFGVEQGPFGMTVDQEGRLWVSDTFRQRLLVFSSEGNFLRQVPLTGGIHPGSLAFAPDGTMLLLDPLAGLVFRLDTLGAQMAVYGGSGNRLGQIGVGEDMAYFGGAMDLLVDGSGHFYVVDTINNRVQKFSPEGRALGAMGNLGSLVGAVNRPQALVFDANTGSYFLADTGNHRVKSVRLGE